MLVQRGMELNIYTDYDDHVKRLVGLKCSDGTDVCNFMFDTSKDVIEKFGSHLATYASSYESQQVFEIRDKSRKGGQWFNRSVYCTIKIVTTKPFKKIRLTANAKFFFLALPVGSQECSFEVTSDTLREWGLKIVDWANDPSTPPLCLVAQ